MSKYVTSIGSIQSNAHEDTDCRMEELFLILKGFGFVDTVYKKEYHKIYLDLNTPNIAKHTIYNTIWNINIYTLCMYNKDYLKNFLY